MVPATKQTVFRYGWQLIQVPFTFNNFAISHIFNGLTQGSFGAQYYDTASGRYVPVQQVQPGQAFWMYVNGVSQSTPQAFTLADDAAIVGQEDGKQSAEQDVNLLPGWNLIGNPFVYPVYWGQVLVYKDGVGTVSLNQAVKNNWISKMPFTWNPDSNSYQYLSDLRSAVASVAGLLGARAVACYTGLPAGDIPGR